MPPVLLSLAKSCVLHHCWIARLRIDARTCVRWKISGIQNQWTVEHDVHDGSARKLRLGASRGEHGNEPGDGSGASAN